MPDSPRPDDESADNRRDAMLLRALRTPPESREDLKGALRREREARRGAAPKDDPKHA